MFTHVLGLIHEGVCCLDDRLSFQSRGGKSFVSPIYADCRSSICLAMQEEDQEKE